MGREWAVRGQGCLLTLRPWVGRKVGEPGAELCFGKGPARDPLPRKGGILVPDPSDLQKVFGENVPFILWFW